MKLLLQVLLAISLQTALSAGEVRIENAVYGAEGVWKDVSGLVQSKAGAELKVGNALFGDPAPARLKTLKMTVLCDGVRSDLVLEEGASMLLSAEGLASFKESASAWSVQKAIDDAYKRGERSIRLKADVYRIKPGPGKGAHLRFSGMKDFSIDAGGSTFVLENPNSLGVVFDSCRNVSLDGAVITRETPPFTQGDVVGIAPDRSYVDIKIHTGYPSDMDDPGYKPTAAGWGGVITFFDEKGKLKKDVLDLAFKIKEIKALGDGVFRVLIKSPFDARMPLAIGDMAAWRRSGSSQLVVLGCGGMRFTNLTISNSSLLAVFEGRGDGGNYYNYKVTYAAPPKGASRKPLLSSAADGFNSADTRKGPTLEGCLWEGMHDDAVNIHGSLSMIIEGGADGPVVNASPSIAEPRPGDRIQFYDEKYAFQGEAKFISWAPIPDYKAPKDYKKPHYYNKKEAGLKACRLKLEREIAAGPGWYMLNADAAGAGYVIRDCVTRDHRARGFLLFSSDGLVENCLIENCGYAGIALSPAFGNCEGAFARNVVIRNNTFREVGVATERWNNGLSVTSVLRNGPIPLPGGHRDILIEGNRFERNDGPNIMLGSAIGVKIKGNVFVKPMTEPYHGLNPMMNPEALVDVVESREVSFEGNRIIDPGPYMKKIVDLGANASASGVESGFKVERSASGIEILKAEYGAGEKSMDATGILRAKLAEGQGTLKIKVGNELFGDPARGQVKTLRVTIRRDGENSELFADEASTFAIDPKSLDEAKAENAKWSVQKAIDDAYKSGKSSVSIAPGVYRIKPPSGKRHLSFSNMKDFEIDASGCVFIFEDIETAGILFDKCRNMTFKGATLLRETPPFSQGDITSISPNRDYVDIKAHDGYPADISNPHLQRTPVLTIYDASGKLKKDVLDLAFAVKDVEDLGDRVFRFNLKRPFDKRIPLSLGDMAAWRLESASTITILGSSKFSLKDVTIKNSAGMTVFEGNGEGGNYYNFTLTYADPPKGATKKPLLSSAADAFMSQNMRKGPVLEKCLWEGMHEDAVNIHGKVGMVMEANAAELVVSTANILWPRPGERIRFYGPDTAPLPFEAKAVSCEWAKNYEVPPNDYKAVGRIPYTDSKKGNFIRLKLDREIPAKFGWFVLDADALGSGFVIRDCVTRDHRNRGFLIYAADGLIENCLIENCTYGGILASPSFRYFGEGPFAENLTIRNNVIRNCGFASPWNSALTVADFRVKAKGCFKNMVVDGNRFENDDGPNIILSATSGAVIKNNLFINPMREPFHSLDTQIDHSGLVAISQSENVSFENNKIIDPGSYMKTPVYLSPTASATGVETGFTIEKRSAPDEKQ